MAQEDKELILKDICGRLPYGLTVQISLFRNDGRKTDIDLDPYVSENIWELIDKYHALPYLRPMSSMTKEEEEEFQRLDTECDKMPTFDYVSIECYRIFDWLNAHHFDYRGLIERGLAIDATGLEIY